MIGPTLTLSRGRGGSKRRRPPLSTPRPQLQPITTQTSPTAQKADKTLADCQERWKEDRTIARKPIRDAYVGEMSDVIALFEQTQGVSDIADIRRQHVVAFRSHLVTSKRFEIATINKK